MIKIGAITIDVSHPRAFATKLIENNMDMRYVAVFNDGFRKREDVEKFSEDFGATIYDNIDDLVDAVDIGFIHCCNWDKHLDYILPFMKKGKPVFVDKPLVGNTADIKKYHELVASGAKILGTSALRYAFEVQNIRQEFAEKNIKPVHTVVSVGVDEFNYAIHAVEQICAIHQPARAVSTRHLYTNVSNGQTCEHFAITFDDGSCADYICMTPKFALFNTIILTNGDHEDDKCFAIDNSKFYVAMLKEVEKAMKGEESLIASPDQTEEAIRIMLAGKASMENGNIDVNIYSELVDKVSFDGYEFETGYARAAGYTDYVAERQ